MTIEQCFVGVCFTPFDGTGQKFFGFSEFLAGLALMVLAWTIADTRYRFRVQIAPIPLRSITFAVVATVGVLTLLTDLWRAEQWLVPKDSPLTYASWQAVLGGLFLLMFLVWTWFAFIRPSTYGRYNAKRFAQTLYRFILTGSPTELAVIADELACSVRALVHHATDRGRLKNYRLEREDKNQNLPKVEEYANGLLLLIADKRLCRAIVESSPGTALIIFQAMTNMKKHGIQVETFAKNIVNEALENRNSFLYHETEGYKSGLIGYHKPLSQAMFANYAMVETIGTMLTPDISRTSEWDADQWEAYCRIVLITFRNYVQEGYDAHSYVLYRAKGHIEGSLINLYKLNGLTSNLYNNDLNNRLRVVINFIKEAVKILDEKGVPDRVHLRVRKECDHSYNHETVYDHIASLIFEVIFHATAVTSPQGTCWGIQYTSVWFELFSSIHPDGPAGRVVKFKLRRLLYNEVVEMNNLSGFRGARILRFCLNVMGLKLRDSNYTKESRALHKALLAWTKKNYDWLYGYNRELAEACLVDDMTYDAENRKIVKTYPAEGLRREAQHIDLEVDAAS